MKFSAVIPLQDQLSKSCQAFARMRTKLLQALTKWSSNWWWRMSAFVIIFKVKRLSSLRWKARGSPLFCTFDTLECENLGILRRQRFFWIPRWRSPTFQASVFSKSLLCRYVFRGVDLQKPQYLYFTMIRKDPYPDITSLALWKFWNPNGLIDCNW